MSVDDDKYPSESGRRRFVKGVVGGSALAAVGSAGAAGINSATKSPGKGGGTTRAMAIENIGGPAPRGMPQIPVEFSDDGYLRGVWPDVSTKEVGGRQVKVAEMELGGVTYSSEWYQYCGVETYGGIEPGYESDNFFRVGPNPGFEWQSEMSEGDRFTKDLFSDYDTWGNGIGKSGLGKPATATWRSQDTDSTIPVQIVRSPLIEKIEKGNAPDVPDSIQKWVKASTTDGFVAWLDKCTHFCCVPGFKMYEASVKFDAENYVYCPCHQSVYDPFSIVETLFTARPRPQ